MSEQQPTVGRIVHYQSYGTPNGEYTPQPRAAVITEIDPPQQDISDGFRDGHPVTVGLCVLNPTVMFFKQHVPYSPEPKPGHWSWPLRG